MEEVKKIVTSVADEKDIRTFDTVYMSDRKYKIKYWVAGILIGFVLLLLLPWTQNIRARGSVTTLRQEQRPQEINAIIPGRIIKWHVKEGDFVKAGDTIVQLAEVKDDYLDPQLLQRTAEQLSAKEAALASYDQKVAAAGQQIEAMKSALELKLQQLSMKVVSDSIEASAAAVAADIAEEQLRRQKIMRDSGLVSAVQLEQRNQNYQNAVAKKMSTQIKFVNTKIELQQVRQEYAEKIFKTESERAAAQSELATTGGEIAKLKNQYANYNIRSGQYFLRASQDGQVVNARKSGINEIIKEGDKLVDIVPDSAQHAVELYVRPVDLPLLSKGRRVRFMFDGFPAIVFSGWPQASYGMFDGEVMAIQSNISSNGKFRILIKEVEGQKPWPKELTFGTGASAIILLKDVPIWYEIWRNINGFPQDYYIEDQAVNKEKPSLKIKMK